MSVRLRRSREAGAGVAARLVDRCTMVVCAIDLLRQVCRVLLESVKSLV